MAKTKKQLMAKMAGVGLWQHDLALMKEEKTKYLIGVDEVGRGCLAGPVVAGAVAVLSIAKLQKQQWVGGVNDSKKVKASKRKELKQKIEETCLWAVGMASVDEINLLGILPATLLAMKRAIEQVNSQINSSDFSQSLVLVDGISQIKGLNQPQKTLVKADSKSWHVAAASIVAKEARDELMRSLAKEEEFANYAWSSNVGYGSKAHVEAIKKLGPTVFHRKLFLRKILQVDSSPFNSSTLPLDEVFAQASSRKKSSTSSIKKPVKVVLPRGKAKSSPKASIKSRQK